MTELKVICRTDRVEAVVDALRAAGVPRLTVSLARSLGSGVDPKDYGLSFEGGAAYTAKAKIEFVCTDELAPRLLEVVRDACCTGQRGDGVIFVTGIERVVKIRTGAENELALL